MTTPHRFTKWLAAGCFLFAGITSLWIHPDPVIKWLGGVLFILMSLHVVWSLKQESRTPSPSSPAKRWPALYSLTLVIAAGWLTLTLLKQMYGPAALFLAALIYAACRRLRQDISRSGA